MPWNGSGAFVRKHDWTNEAALGTPILAANFDDDTDDIVTAGLGNCITRDGQGGPVANISWNGFKIQGLGTPTLINDAATKGYVDTATSDRSMGGFKLTNLANPTNPQDAATMAWVLGTTTALPSQTGNAGKFLKTSGTLASWEYAFITTINSTVTTDTTLTGNFIYVPVQMASMGKSVKLPDATTLPTGGPQYVVDNSKGTYPAGIRDSAGTLIMAVAPGGEALVSLKDNSTAAGVWSVTGVLLEPGLITVDSTFSSTYSATPLAPYIALDSNTSIHFAALSSGFAAFVVDNTGKVVSTPVTVTASAETLVQCFRVSATSAIVFYGTSTTTNRAVILTLTGSSPSLSLSVGTAQTVSTGGGTFFEGENFQGAPKIVQLTSTLYACTLPDTGVALKVVAFSVSGATITIGSTATIIGTNFSLQSSIAYALTASTFLVIYKSGAAAPFTNNAVVVSVSGTTCTVGTPAALTGVGSQATGASSAVLVSATKAIVADDNAGSTGSVTVGAVTISGTTVTAGTALSIETGMGALTSPIYTLSGATRYNGHLWTISAGATNIVGLWYLDAGTNISRVLALSETSGTITAGQIVYNSLSSAASGSAGYGFMLPQGSTEFMAIRNQLGSTAGFGMTATSHKVSGTTVTWGQSKPLRNIAQNSAAIALRLSSGDYVTSGDTPQGGNAISVLRSNGDAISYRGDVACTALQNTVLRNQQGVVSGNRAVLIGGTNLAGSTINASTYQLRLLNVEIAA